MCVCMYMYIGDYFRIVAILESQMSSQTSTQHNNNNKNLNNQFTLRRLLVWIQNPLERLKLMVHIHIYILYSFSYYSGLISFIARLIYLYLYLCIHVIIILCRSC